MQPSGHIPPYSEFIRSVAFYCRPGGGVAARLAHPDDLLVPPVLPPRSPHPHGVEEGVGGEASLGQRPGPGRGQGRRPTAVIFSPG